MSATATRDVCLSCGAELLSDQAWCTSCGRAARTAIAPAPAWRRPLVAAVALAAVALVALALAFVLLTRNDNQVPAPAPAVTTTP